MRILIRNAINFVLGSAGHFVLTDVEEFQDSEVALRVDYPNNLVNCDTFFKCK